MAEFHPPEQGVSLVRPGRPDLGCERFGGMERADEGPQPSEGLAVPSVATPVGSLFEQNLEHQFGFGHCARPMVEDEGLGGDEAIPHRFGIRVVVLAPEVYGGVESPSLGHGPSSFGMMGAAVAAG